MQQPRSRVPALGFLLVAIVLAAACSGSEQSIVGQFFSASRLRDNTSLDNIATVIFDPRTQGSVTTFTVQNVSPEQRKPLPLKALAKAQDDAKTEDEAFSRRKEEYQNANLEAIQRVLKAERDNTKLAPKDAEVQTAWTKYREETAAMSKKVADSRRTLKAATQLVDQSINAGGRSAIDVTKHDGEIVSKDVTVSAPVRLPSGETIQKTLVLTLERAELKGDKDIAGRWIVTKFRDDAPAAASK
jgi:hypothetical protein